MSTPAATRRGLGRRGWIVVFGALGLILLAAVALAVWLVLPSGYEPVPIPSVSAA